MALTLNGKKSNFKRRDFLEFGENMGLRQKQISNFLGRMEDRFENSLEVVANSYLPPDMKEVFTKLMRQRAARLF